MTRLVIVDDDPMVRTGLRLILGGEADLEMIEAVRAVARGGSNAEIAERPHMSVATVKANITRIFAKLETGNRVTVAMKVRDAGLL